MVICLVIGWAIWPGSFFLVALICESRIPPLWKHQSKAFFPGDLTLPVMWVAMFRLSLNRHLLIGPLASIVSLVALFIIEAGIFCVVTKVVAKDRSNYPERSANSPTKIYHDLVGYYVFPMSIAPFFVFYVTSHIENRVGVSWSILWVILPLVFYILCVIYDMRKGASAEDIGARHPSDWKPIWETSATVRKATHPKMSMTQFLEGYPKIGIAIALWITTIAAVTVSAILTS